jgi:DNA helicase-2/ATP-dependent DNA helicase PcrA
MIQSFQVITKTKAPTKRPCILPSTRACLKDLYEDKSVEGLNRYENIQELLNGYKRV